MEEEIKRSEVSGDPEANTAKDYISAINEIKQNSVPRTEFDKVCEEKKMLLDSLVNGTGEAVNEPEKPKESVEELREKLFSNELNNLDYAQTVLNLRAQLIEQGETDPFLPTGRKISYNEDDVKAANRVADALQSCIDVAEGDSDIFTRELSRITVDNVATRRR